MPGYIPEQFVQSVLAKIDIVDIIGSRLKLRRAGSSFVACCPFHAEKTPSFSVCSARQIYTCFGCGVTGDVIQFLKEYEKITFVEAMENLAATLGLDIPRIKRGKKVIKQVLHQHEDIYAILHDASAYFELQLRRHPRADKAVQYLKNRGLTGEVAKQFKLGFAPPGWKNLLHEIIKKSQQPETWVKAGLLVSKEADNYYDRFQNRIMFPISNKQGKIIAFGARTIDDSSDSVKYLNSPQSDVFNKGQELFGLYEALQSNRRLQQLIVVEGYMDVLTLVQANITNVVATLGTACTVQHLSLIHI